MSIFAPDEDREQRWGATLERSQPGTQCFRMGRYLMVRPFFLIHNHHYGNTLFTIIDD